MKEMKLGKILFNVMKLMLMHLTIESIYRVKNLREVGYRTLVVSELQRAFGGGVVKTIYKQPN
jgi:hypothetical protein